MIKILRYSLLVITFTAALFAATGCSQKQTSDAQDTVVFQMIPSTENVEHFIEVLGDYDSGDRYGYDSDTCYNVTPQDITDRYGFEIFKFDASCSSFLLYEEKVYPLGIWFGGSGVTSFAVTDLNADGGPELFFTFSWGSGLHRSQVGYFDTASKETVLFEFADYGYDSVLKTDSDNHLCVYRADLNVKSFVDIELTAGAKTASLIMESGKISLVEEIE